jgi:hypothetical protein
MLQIMTAALNLLIENEMKKVIYKFIMPALMIGALMSSCYYDQVVPIDPVIEVGEVTFSADILPIFNQSCNGAGCHNGAVAPNLLQANAYNALKNGNYINTANPESSELYQWMKGKRSLPMPLSGSNATYNATVLAWIEQGALNN